MTTIMVAGCYGFGNLGDEAVLEGMLTDLRGCFPDLDPVVVSGNPSWTRQVHSARAVGWTDSANILKEMHGSDLVILGGGGLFHDYWEVNPELVGSFESIGQHLYASIPLLSHLLKKPCMTYGIGLGPLSDEGARGMTSAALTRCQLVSVRDEQSRELAQDLLGETGERIVVTADPAFSLVPARVGPANQGAPRLGVCLRSWKPGASLVWEREVALALDAFLNSSGGEIVFLPFEVRAETDGEDDAAVAHRVQSELRPSAAVRVLQGPLSIDQALKEISRCDLILGMRYHSILFSVLCDTRVVALSYDPKVSQLMSQVGLEDWALPPSEWDSGTVTRLLQSAQQQPVPPAEFLPEMANRARENARMAAALLRVPLTEPSALDQVAQRLAIRYLTEREQVETLRRHVNTMRAQAECLAQDRHRLGRELVELRETLGFRALDLYWSQVRKIFPEGGLGRRIYRRAGTTGRRALQALGVVKPLPPQARNRPPEWTELEGSAGTNGLQTPFLTKGDVNMNLTWFERHVAQLGATHVVAIYSSTPFSDGEGQRPTHLAISLAARGIPVVFAYWRWDKNEWSAQQRLAEGILEVPIDLVVEDPTSIFGKFSGARRTVLFEFPHPGFFESLAVARGRGWQTVYDVLDDWQAFAGVGWSTWYDREMEAHFARGVDTVLCVNDTLVEKMAAIGRTAPVLIPNGCPERIGEVDAPVSLDRGEVNVGYFGHLSEGWFDWKLVINAARERPNWLFYVIGYGGRRRSDGLPSNVRLLGRKTQSSLAAYAANWDVAMVPFKAGPLALGSDPIKTYEYLAMGLPVVVTGCQAPVGASGLVYRAEGTREFIDLLELAASGGALAASMRKQFAETATWPGRVSSILASLDNFPSLGTA